VPQLIPFNMIHTLQMGIYFVKFSDGQNKEILKLEVQ
jgi:hypothetical protein